MAEWSKAFPPLLREYRENLIKGSNPSLSANFDFPPNGRVSVFREEIAWLVGSLMVS